MILTAYLCDSLDALAIGACEFDAEHRTICWNRSFTEFFPEHAGHVHAGEPYAENLRRFYRQRVRAEEIGDIELYVAEGIARHENQTQPFEFTHRGRRLRASSLPAPGGGRLRLWHQVARADAVEIGSDAIPAVDALEFIPDGATILDADDRVIASNNQFRRLYDVPPDRAIVGATLDEIIADAWRRHRPDGPLHSSVRNRLRYDGAPFEVELPGERWLRVIARHTSDGLGYFTHADISAHKRQQLDLLSARDALRQANTDLSRLASTDALTGLANRRLFAATLAAEAERPAPVSLVIIDVDHFKGINDRFGHPTGDACLCRIATAIEAAVAPSGALAARIGGEEFAVVLPDTPLSAARDFAAAIRQAIASLPWDTLQPGLHRLTVSAGVCAAEGPVSAEAIQSAADRALYAAKRNGRDRVETIALDGSLDRLIA